VLEAEAFNSGLTALNSDDNSDGDSDDDIPAISAAQRNKLQNTKTELCDQVRLH